MGLLQGVCKARSLPPRSELFLESFQEPSKISGANSSKSRLFHAGGQHLILIALLIGLANGNEGDKYGFFGTFVKELFTLSFAYELNLSVFAVQRADVLENFQIGLVTPPPPPTHTHTHTRTHHCFKKVIRILPLTFYSRIGKFPEMFF